MEQGGTADALLHAMNGTIDKHDQDRRIFLAATWNLEVKWLNDNEALTIVS